eukprot:gene12257-15403_t
MAFPSGPSDVRGASIDGARQFCEECGASAFVVYVRSGSGLAGGLHRCEPRNRSGGMIVSFLGSRSSLDVEASGRHQHIQK